MPNITLSLPEDVYKIMNKHKEIRWSEVARRAIVTFSQKIEWLDDIDREKQLKQFNDLLRNSEVTEEEAETIGEQVKESIYKRLVDKLQ